MSHKKTVIESVLSLHQQIINLHRDYGDDQTLKKVDDFMLSLKTMGLLEGIKINDKAGRYFLIEGKSWIDACKKNKIEAEPNFVIWEETEFFSFMESMLKSLGYQKNKELVKF